MGYGNANRKKSKFQNSSEFLGAMLGAAAPNFFCYSEGYYEPYGIYIM